ncbi:MAG: hypothetical protein IJ558_02150 [Treponema sp.]|nr:hypothetical protein [Treponema sp.]
MLKKRQMLTNRVARNEEPFFDGKHILSAEPAAKPTRMTQENAQHWTIKATSVF